MVPSWQLEQTLWQAGYSLVAGLDEAGRGALAGPVVVAAVILPYAQGLPYRDSKQLRPAKRESLAANIKQDALAWSVASADPREIDRHNIYRATQLAALRALAALPGWRAVVTDYLPLSPMEANRQLLAVAKADTLSVQVAAASILAKTTRDQHMRGLDAVYPGYGFAAHKGYGSPQHVKALAEKGPCDVHRRSFKPVAAATSSAK